MNKQVFYKFATSDYDEENGIVKAVPTSFGNADKIGDIIMPGALDNFIKEYNEMPGYYQHDKTEYVGEWSNFSVEGKKFRSEFQFDMHPDNETAKNVRRYIKTGKLKFVSIGISPRGKGSYDYYETDKSPWGMARKFKDINLSETSFVFVPMNDKAQIEAYKSYQEFQNEGVIETIELVKNGEYDLREIERLLCKYMTRSEAKEFISKYRKFDKIEQPKVDVVETFKKQLEEKLNK